MRSYFNIVLYIVFAIVSAEAISQPVLKPDLGDPKYREDQFYLGITYNLVNSVPSDVELNGFSGGLHFGFLRDMPINEQRTLAIAIGAGLGIDQYGSTLFIGETESGETIFTGLSSDQINVEFDTNRFSTAVIEVPLEFRWRTSTMRDYSFWRIYAGFRLGYTYWYKATFSQTNNTVNQTDIPEYDRMRMAATLSFGYSKINFYANYSINPFFKDAVSTAGDQVDFRSLKLGIILYIL